MLDFIITTVIWTLALYGLFEIIKNVIYIFNCCKLRTNGTYVIIATKNQESQIENFIRVLMFRILYGKEDCVKNIILADLDSKDNTMEILKKLEKDYDGIQTVTWRECIDIMNQLNSSEKD